MDFDNVADHSHMFLGPWGEDVGWNHRAEFSHYEDSWDAFSDQQHAALNSILSKINLTLTPRVKSRDASVQVNPRRDVSVQCSIGPKTLSAMKLDLLSRRRKEFRASGFLLSAVRFPPTLAVYSPMAYRNVASYLVDSDDPLESTCDTDKCEDRGAETEASPQEEEGSGGGPREEERSGGGPREEERSGTRSSSRVDFQFLEQKYGYYHCKVCNLRWESAYVWCIAGTNKVYFKQFCRRCQNGLNPYTVEDIKCSACKKQRCLCEQTQRHINPKRPHRQDLCGRCKDRRLSCDSTFSFKYIV